MLIYFQYTTHLISMDVENDLLPGEEWKPSSLAESFDYGSWPNPIAAGVSLGSLIAKHQKYTDAWTSSSGYSACRELLANTVLKQANIEITQCMCLCLSSLSTEAHEFHKDYSRPMSQLVAFEGWVDLLSMCQPIASGIILRRRQLLIIARDEIRYHKDCLPRSCV